MFDYDAESSKAVDELDKYDLTDILKGVNGIEVHDVAEEIRIILELERVNRNWSMCKHLSP